MIRVEFVGALAGTGQPAMTSSNPLVRFTHSSGGVIPSYVRTPQGGPPDPPVPMKGQWIWELGQTWLLYFFDSPLFSATDQVDVNVTAGWCTVGNPAVVPLPAATVRADNRHGGTLLDPLDMSPKTMPVGYNVQPEDYYAEGIVFSDMGARLCFWRSAQVATGPVTAFDADGYPTQGTAGNVTVILTEPSTPTGATLGTVNQEGVNNKGPYNAPNGLYVVYWDGPVDGLTFAGDFTTGCTEVAQYQVLTGTTGNRRAFNVQADPGQAYAPKIQVSVNASGPAVGGLYPFATTNIHVYPPDPSDPTGNTPWLPGGGTTRGVYPKFHPSFMYKIRGAASLRFVESIQGLQNTWRFLYQIKADGQLGRSGETIIAGSAMINIRAYTGPPVSSPLNIQVQITTNGPHGFFVGLPVTFQGGSAVATFSDNQTMTFAGPSNCVTSIIDDVNFTMTAVRAAVGHPDVAMVGTIGNGGYCGLVNAQVGTSFALSDCADMCNQNGSHCYFNFPASVDDAAVSYVANYFATHLNPGLKLYVEYAIEARNYLAAPSFNVLCTFEFQEYGTADDYHLYYVWRAGEVHNLCLAEFANVGRPSTDVVRVLGLNNADPGDTTGHLAPAIRSLSPQPVFDCAAIATYYNAMDCQDYRTDFPGLTTMTQAISNTLSISQLMDVLEFRIDSTDIASASLNAVRSIFPGIDVITYEGGPESLIPGLSATGPGFDTTVDKYARMHALHRHPRMFGVERRFLQGLQDQGIALHHDLYVFGGSGWQAYSAYEWYNQEDGTGNPSENPIPEAMDSIVSQMGGAIHSWVDLLSTEPRLTLMPEFASVIGGLTTVALTATLYNAPDSLTASLSGGTGNLSTASPSSGIPFTYTPPPTDAGSVAVTVQCPTLGLTAISEVSYAPSGQGPPPPASPTIAGPPTTDYELFSNLT